MNNTWTSDTYQQNAAYVPALGAAVFALLNPQPRDEVEALLRPEICDSEGHWTAHYVRLRFLTQRT